VRILDDKSYKGVVVGFDESLDIAVIKISDSGFPFVKPSQVRATVGDELVIIGYPESYDLLGPPSLTKGIVSAYRFVDGYNYIQTDAALNSGVSGGAAFTSDGQYIGIPTWKLRDTENMGFLIPLLEIVDVIPDMIGGKVYRIASTPTPTPRPRATPTPYTSYPYYYGADGSVIWGTPGPRATATPVPEPLPNSSLCGKQLRSDSNVDESYGFLGIVSGDVTKPDSIMNSSGDYGSTGIWGIWNPNGPYGGASRPYSAFNKNPDSPPYIVIGPDPASGHWESKGNATDAVYFVPGPELLRLYVTVNSEFTLPGGLEDKVVRWGVIDPLDLKEWLTTNCLDS